MRDPEGTGDDPTCIPISIFQEANLNIAGRGAREIVTVNLLTVRAHANGATEFKFQYVGLKFSTTLTIDTNPARNPLLQVPLDDGDIGVIFPVQFLVKRLRNLSPGGIIVATPACRTTTGTSATIHIVG